jgi:hypothetical protein
MPSRPTIAMVTHAPLSGVLARKETSRLGPTFSQERQSVFASTIVGRIRPLRREDGLPAGSQGRRQRAAGGLVATPSSDRWRSSKCGGRRRRGLGGTLAAFVAARLNQPPEAKARLRASTDSETGWVSQRRYDLQRQLAGVGAGPPPARRWSERRRRCGEIVALAFPAPQTVGS